MSSGKTKYIINDIYDIIVKQIVYTYIVHCVSNNITMQLVDKWTAFIIDSHCYLTLIGFFLLIFLNLLIFYFRREVFPYLNVNGQIINS